MTTRFAASLFFSTATLSLTLSACSMGGQDKVAQAAGTALGIDTTALDKTVKPGDDFNLYANNSWVKRTEIPDDRSSMGGFTAADILTEKQLSDLISDVTKGDPSPDSDSGRVKALYASFLDTKTIDSAGMGPMKADLDRFMAITDVKSLSKVLGEQLRADVDPFNNTNFNTENLFGLFVTQALSGSAVMPYLLQGGLGMPEREYYLSSDAKMVGVRTKYRAFIAQLLTDAGIADADAKAQRIFDLETKIAQAHDTREKSENMRASSTEWTRGEMEKRAPGIDWAAFLGGAQLGKQEHFAAYHADAIARLSALVASQPIGAWKEWLVFHQINSHADVLPSKIDADRFAFYGTTLQGTKAQRPREKRAIRAVNAWLGDALGKLYVERYFPASSKNEIQGMVNNIKDAFATRVQTITWMAPSTRKEAIEKVRNIDVGIGYPDKWKDYSGYTLKPDTAYANAIGGEQTRYAQQIAKIGKPLDRREWWMNSQLVNAVNLPVQNALNFPAAILQRPFFDPKADAAYNYGAIGSVIGHEISHSFDNNGADFDSSGKLRNWWTPADQAHFRTAGKALAAQFSAYEPFPGLHVNGDLTLGENIADVAGLAAALDAYHASLKGKQAPVIAGYTGDQRFFISYAQSRATKMRDEALRGRIATDGHAPGMYRAMTVRNLDAWYRAFDVQPGDKLYLPPEKRVKVW